MIQDFKKDFTELIDLIHSKKPFALSRFADGEVAIMKGIQKNGADKWISPDYLTIEVQNKETVEYLLNNFKYKCFNFVLGHRISKDYKSINLKTHSAGPLGNDFKFKWVNNSKIAVQFVLNYEEGAENSVLNGDNQSEILF